MNVTAYQRLDLCRALSMLGAIPIATETLVFTLSICTWVTRLKSSISLSLLSALSGIHYPCCII